MTVPPHFVLSGLHAAAADTADPASVRMGQSQCSAMIEKSLLLIKRLK
jgi:hypothetical protein